VLIRFRVENHRSIRDEQEFSLVASPLSGHAESLVRVDRYDLDLLRVAAVYGANASGKSTLFDALSFMRSAVTRSQRSWRPDGGIARVPFALDSKMSYEPSLFAIDLVLDGVRYEYGFIVNSSRVLEEWLHAYPKGRKQEWFIRDAARKEEFSFSRLLAGENRSISTLTRPNSLFLSAAVQNNHEALAPIYNWFSRSLSIVDNRTRSLIEARVAERCMDDSYRAAVLSMLKSADLGITNLEVEEEVDLADVVEVVLDMFRGHGDDSLSVDEVPNAIRRSPRVQLKHESGTSDGFALPFDHESQGTRTLFSLAGLMVDVLATGGTLVVDELDRSLHPHLAIEIVNIFNDPTTNRNNAQLVFNTHDTNLLDTSILRRDQIWFTEKGDDGATRLFPLTDFRARKYENLERGYLQGRYGAVPSVRSPDLRKIVGG
jgi:hypothetical protein